jgi:hypothetical protein
MVFTLDCF